MPVDGERKGKRRLIADCRASLAVEFALVIPLVFALVFAMVDAGRLLLADVWMRHLTAELADGIRLDTAPAAREDLSAADAETLLTGRVSGAVSGLVDPAHVSLILEIFDSLADAAAGSPAPDSGPGARNRLVTYRVSYQVSLITPFASLLYDNGAVVKSAEVMVRNGG